MLCASSAINLVLMGVLIKNVIQLKSRNRCYSGKKWGGTAAIIASIFICSAAGICIYFAPRVLIAPGAVNQGILSAASLSLELMVVLLCTWFVFDEFFPKKDDSSYFSLIVLGVMSGFGNFLIISIINASLNTNENAFELAFYFLFGILTYLSCQKLLRTRFVYLANRIVYKKRKTLIEKILNTSYQDFEGVDSGKIYAGLNNDTEAVSETANLLILASTASITIFFCMIYLAAVDWKGLAISLCLIIIAALFYYKVGNKARKIWNQSRDIQNIFFKFIGNMVGGFKELAVHSEKKSEFTDDMLDKCGQYRDKKSEASIKFTNVFILGEFMFTSVVGAAAFLMPVLFSGTPDSTIRSFVLIFLYMSSPVYTLLNTIPNLIQVKISWERILELERSFSSYTEPENTPIPEAHADDSGSFSVSLRDVSYSYKDAKSSTFSVGPVSCEFKAGEITFITGGNGSGKSTLAKLVTGLYPADSGEIMINNKITGSSQLGQYFSVIFSDSFIFERLYGIDWRGKEDFISEQLRLLRLNSKICVENGVFSSTELSTGQRKRLALLVSYLEDRPVYLFDEWAADQDPVFRKFFYQDLIFKLKHDGKCVIAITHDDHYFHLADKVIKMNLGKIKEETGVC